MYCFVLRIVLLFQVFLACICDHPVRLRLPPLQRRGIFFPANPSSFPSSGGVPRRGGVVIAICLEELLHQRFFMGFERGELLGL